MGAMNKLLEWVGIEAGGGDDEFDNYEDLGNTAVVNTKEKENNPGRRGRQGKVVSLNEITSQLKVVIMRPADFEEAQDIANHLKSKKPVVINLEGLDKSVAKRIIDFLSGAVYALDGNIQKVAAGIFFIAPHNVGILDNMHEDYNFDRKISFPWN